MKRWLDYIEFILIAPLGTLIKSLEYIWLMLLRLVGLLAIFTTSTLMLIIAWTLRPEAQPAAFFSAAQNRPNSYFPKTVSDLNLLVNYFTKYRENHSIYLSLLFSLAYLYKQSFAIPGSFAMNILAGALFGCWKALLLVCLLTTVGASCCYMLSLWFAKPVVEYFFDEQLQRLRYEFTENRYRRFTFLLCARLFPFTPQWLLNICLPLVNIPLSSFALSVFIGLIPYNLLCVQAGSVLSDLEDFSAVFSFTTTVRLTGLTIMIFLFSKIMKKSFCTTSSKYC
uniref:SNARE associated Golgi protein n=1 Tax=Setaria digitata TaxID=48799 RepID=A0A915Q7H9_9BILA